MIKTWILIGCTIFLLHCDTLKKLTGGDSKDTAPAPEAPAPTEAPTPTQHPRDIHMLPGCETVYEQAKQDSIQIHNRNPKEPYEGGSLEAAAKLETKIRAKEGQCADFNLAPEGPQTYEEVIVLFCDRKISNWPNQLGNQPDCSNIKDAREAVKAWKNNK